jgi:hypothetical protein
MSKTLNGVHANSQAANLHLFLQRTPKLTTVEVDLHERRDRETDI